MSASLAPQCNEVKERYDTCFLKWYSEKYLRGNGTTDECAPLFKEYQQCLNVALKERGIDKMLEEAREDHKENDATNLRSALTHEEMMAFGNQDVFLRGVKCIRPRVSIFRQDL